MKMGKALKDYEKPPKYIPYIRLERTGDTVYIHVYTNDEWHELWCGSLVGDFTMNLSKESIENLIIDKQVEADLKVKSVLVNTLLCQEADNCEHSRADDCIHAKPHKRIRNDCSHGYDTDPDDEFCCPSCVPMIDDSKDFIKIEDMQV